ncbi:HD domain-containing protein [Caldilinea sp.]|jgi:putative hydrolase of HD superfamily|nr:HD domain-containing protein [Caldilinea sp.]GIV68725.1 MAG: phosphohydrolase [Caldilinea sp.]GIV69491.1 MAG: phosphohydrolase [Caldilinea sp.]
MTDANMNNAKTNDRLAAQLAFLLEIDRLKRVLRRTAIVGGERRENSAEHSWHLAVMAMVLAEHANEPIDLLHTIKLVLVHDIVEIDAGDTFAYDAQANLDKEERERAAADRIFSLLPDDQREELRSLWEEFDARQTPEARFANALDRLMPSLQNYVNNGGTWREPGVDREAVFIRLQPIQEGSQTLWNHVEAMLNNAVEQGLIRKVA